MSLLLLETVEWTPHLETGLEIALRAREEGKSVHYLCLRGLGNFFEDRPFKARSRWHKRDFMQPKNWRALDILHKHGVQIHSPFVRADAQPVPRFDDLEQLKAYCESDWDIGMGVASSLISWSKWTRADPNVYQDAIGRMIRAGRLIYKNVQMICEQTRPDEVILFNGRFASTRPALRAIQAAGLKWRVHERGCDPSHYYLYDFIPHDLKRWSDQIMTESLNQSWDTIEMAAGRYYSRRRSGGAKDWHSFANWERGNLGHYDYLKARRPVVYMSSSDDEFAAIGEVLSEAAFPSQIDALRHIAACCRKKGQHLVIRLHPHLAQKHPDDLRWWHEQLGSLEATVIDAAEKVDSYALMDAASVCISYGSTAGVEATYWGKQHLMVGRAIYETLPGVQRLRSPSELAEMIENPPPLNREGAIRYGWYMETFGRIFQDFCPSGLFDGLFQGKRLDTRVGWWEWWRGDKILREALSN